MVTAAEVSVAELFLSVLWPVSSLCSKHQGRLKRLNLSPEEPVLPLPEALTQGPRETIVPFSGSAAQSAHAPRGDSAPKCFSGLVAAEKREKIQGHTPKVTSLSHS